ncbi:uncharacterized protein LOC116028749 [Ipomoea triloba]|uniref:uncharacterized protein LOC116028749 n=1 Tax=Ipomoea triloba TaxID=35885 RepID=UPI00125D4D8E|nr:uncharacterized protein LOC116028749 [Ipomoea triloba]
MVLWEITLATAYFLGLKRTYRLALRIQRRVIRPKYPKIRQFAHRRTRAVFDVVLKFHRKIQERDLEAGRNLGNWILRWLDKAKPTANIRGEPPSIGSPNKFNSKPLANSTPPKKLDSFQKFDAKQDQDSSRHLFTSSRNMWPKAFPTVAMMMRPTKPAGTSIHYRQFSISRLGDFKANLGSNTYSGMVRPDIMQWIQRGHLTNQPTFAALSCKKLNFLEV